MIDRDGCNGCGSTLGTPRDHYRPLGHQDTTIAVSPTDDAILFNAIGTGGRDLYLLDLTDFKVTRIAQTPEYDTAPSFSADGLWIVFAAGVPGDRADHIFTIRHDGSEKTQLTEIDANDTSPRFSPDGKTIVFARDKTYNWGGLAANWEPGGVICRIDADGTNLRQLTSDEDFAFEPYFSADGTRPHAEPGRLLSARIHACGRATVFLARRMARWSSGFPRVQHVGSYCCWSNDSNAHGPWLVRCSTQLEADNHALTECWTESPFGRFRTLETKLAGARSTWLLFAYEITTRSLPDAFDRGLC